MGGKGRIGNNQGGGGDTSTITYSAEKCPSDPVSCLFECLFSDVFNTSVLSFDVMMIKDEYLSLVLFHH